MRVRSAGSDGGGLSRISHRRRGADDWMNGGLLSGRQCPAPKPQAVLAESKTANTARHAYNPLAQHWCWIVLSPGLPSPLVRGWLAGSGPVPENESGRSEMIGKSASA